MGVRPSGPGEGGDREVVETAEGDMVLSAASSAKASAEPRVGVVERI